MGVVSNWISSSVMASSSFSSVSASNANTSSYSITSSLSINANNLIYPNVSTASYLAYPNTSTASYSVNGLSASYSNTASFVKNAVSASYAPPTISASWASSSLFSNSANSSTSAVSASWASSSFSSTSASFSLKSISSSYSVTADTASFISLPYSSPYPYIYSMSLVSQHDDSVNIVIGNQLIYTWNNVPGTYNGFRGFTSSSFNPLVGMFSYGVHGSSYLLEKLTFNSITNKYVMSGGTIINTDPASGSVTGPLQLMTMFWDNRGNGSNYWNLQNPLIVTFVVAPSSYKTYTVNFDLTNTPNFEGSTLTIDARMVNYQAFSSRNYPIYQDFSVVGPYSTDKNYPMRISSITSS